MRQEALQPDRPQPAPALPAAAVSAVPAALRWNLEAAGVALTPDIEQAARLIANSKLSQVTRACYGYRLGVVARWCDEHGLDLLDLSPLDMAALVVACRDSGGSPKETLTALAFVYRHKKSPQESVAALARRVDRVWCTQNRVSLRPRRRAVMLPLPCWEAMHNAVGGPGYLARPHDRNVERLARDRLIMSLGLSGGLRGGELGRLSASRSRVEAGCRLVLPLVADERGGANKTGRGHIVVPLGVPPFDVFPVEDDFKRLRDLRMRRGGDDYLVANTWHHGMRGGLCTTQVVYILHKAAKHAGVAGGERLSGHSLRHSMAHISAAAGWSVAEIAATMGHGSTKEVERHYLDGYLGRWSRSGEGRRLLLEDGAGWQDCAPNIASGGNSTHPESDGPLRHWWAGRNLEADRERAMELARSTPRVSTEAPAKTALIASRWEAFCAKAHADAARPTAAALEGFATSLAAGSSTHPNDGLYYLKDYFAAQPTIDVDDLSDIERWVSDAARLAGRIAAANRNQTRHTPRRREIVLVTDAMMSEIFSVPLTGMLEGVRLLGLVLDQAPQIRSLSRYKRGWFRFGEHARITADEAELLIPAPAGSRLVHGPWPATAEVRVPRCGAEPLWSAFGAVRSLIERFPDRSLVSTGPPGSESAHCTPLIRWHQARAAVAVLYATGLRPGDLDGIRWPDLRENTEGEIVWRLPYSKGNLRGDRDQVLALHPVDEPWCPVKALRDLANCLKQAQAAGWAVQAAAADSDGTVRRLFPPKVSADVTNRLMKPAGLDARPQDFRYRKAARVFAQTQDMQAVRSALFHRSAETSAVYVRRGLTPSERTARDPMSGIFPDTRSIETGDCKSATE